MIPTSYINGCTKNILPKNSSWRYLNEIQPHFIPEKREHRLFHFILTHSLLEILPKNAF